MKHVVIIIKLRHVSVNIVIRIVERDLALSAISANDCGGLGSWAISACSSSINRILRQYVESVRGKKHPKARG